MDIRAVVVIIGIVIAATGIILWLLRKQVSQLNKRPLCPKCGRLMTMYPMPRKGIIAYYCPKCDKMEEE
jgi:predicted RNA-binding Zn-ribbon protein involved in translation (DUF1610 family)